MPSDELANFRARMAQPPKDWIEAALVAVLKDPVFYTAVGLGAFFLLVVLALFATKVLTDLSFLLEVYDPKRGGRLHEFI